MKYLMILIVLLTANVFASDYDQCVKFAEKGYNKCMQRFGRLSDMNASVCEDSYIYNVSKCKPEVVVEDYRACGSICLSGLNRCLAHHARFDNTDVCEDAYTYCLERCEGH